MFVSKSVSAKVLRVGEGSQEDLLEGGLIVEAGNVAILR